MAAAERQYQMLDEQAAESLFEEETGPGEYDELLQDFENVDTDYIEDEDYEDGLQDEEAVDIEDERYELMQQYGLDSEEGWDYFDETGTGERNVSDGAYDIEITQDDDDVESAGIYDIVLEDTEDYTVSLDDVDTVLEDEQDVYGRFFSEGDDDYMEIAVVEQDMGTGLHGWTRPGEGVAHVNKALYKVDKEKTARHEIEHNLNPHLDELTIRYINGDIDVENTLSFQADTGGRMVPYETDAAVNQQRSGAVSMADSGSRQQYQSAV